jgi:hypothetical protein
LKRLLAASSVNGDEIQLARAKEAIDLAMKNSQGGRVGKMRLEGADELVKEILVEIVGIAGSTGVQVIEFVS